MARVIKDAETRDRTGDLQIFGLTLSQLSYRGNASGFAYVNFVSQTHRSQWHSCMPPCHHESHAVSKYHYIRIAGPHCTALLPYAAPGIIIFALNASAETHTFTKEKQFWLKQYIANGRWPSHELGKTRQCVRVVKEMDSKSIGLCPQGFESPRCRSMHDTSYCGTIHPARFELATFSVLG